MRKIFLWFLIWLASFSGFSQVGVVAATTFQSISAAPTPESYYHDEITVADGTANIFVYQPVGIESPPSGGWPIILDFGGDGTDSDATTIVTGDATTTSDNLTYTVDDLSIGSNRILSTSVEILVDAVVVGTGSQGGTITGTGISSGSVTSLTSGTPDINVTFSSSQSGHTVTFNYIYSTRLLEGITMTVNQGDDLDSRVIFIGIQNVANNLDYNQDYFDEAVEWAFTNYTININRISVTGISRGGVAIIDRCQEAANTSILKTRYQFWVDDTTGEVFTSDGAGRTETGLSSLAVCAPSYGGTFTQANYTRVGQAIVHGTADGTVTNATTSYTNNYTDTDLIETPQVLNLQGVDHNSTAWHTNYAQRKYAEGGVAQNAPWDFVDFVLKYSYDDLEAATLHVEQAEKRRLGTETDIIDYRHALRRVNLLGASAEKTALLDRLETLRDDIEGAGVRWVLNHHNFGNNETATGYNNITNHADGQSITNMVDFTGGASSLDWTVTDNNLASGYVADVGSRMYFTGGFTRTANKSGFYASDANTTVGFSDVTSGTYTVRFWHNEGGNFTNNATLSVTLNSQTKTQYSGINTMLGYIEFTSVPHTALGSYTVVRNNDRNTLIMITEIFLHE